MKIIKTTRLHKEVEEKQKGEWKLHDTRVN
jgi:hypothetical protein